MCAAQQEQSPILIVISLTTLAKQRESRFRYETFWRDDLGGAAIEWHGRSGSGGVGSVDFSIRDTHDAKMGNFKGYAIGLTARDSDVTCDRVAATFGKGRTRQIFHGELPR